MKSFIVIGLGKFGVSVARVLSSLGHDVLAIDNREEIVQELSDSVTHVIQADVTNEEVFKSLGVNNFDAAIVSIGDNIESSILATVLLKEAGAKYVLAKAQSELHARVLYKVGADKVVFVERDMGIRTAHNLISDNVEDIMEISSAFSVVELRPPRSWIGKSLKELNIRSTHGINIIAIKRQDAVNAAPGPDTIIGENDILVVFGENKDLNAFEK